eukprot:264778-Prymnesium_polylepis.2
MRAHSPSGAPHDDAPTATSPCSLTTALHRRQPPLSTSDVSNARSFASCSGASSTAQLPRARAVR